MGDLLDFGKFRKSIHDERRRTFMERFERADVESMDDKDAFVDLFLELSHEEKKKILYGIFEKIAKKRASVEEIEEVLVLMVRNGKYDLKYVCGDLVASLDFEERLILLENVFNELLSTHLEVDFSMIYGQWFLVGIRDFFVMKKFYEMLLKHKSDWRVDDWITEHFEKEIKKIQDLYDKIVTEETKDDSKK